MGSLVSRSMDKSFQKNQEFLMEMHMIQLERQIQVQNQMRERVAAMQMAKQRELFYWLGTFYVVATFVAVAGYKRNNNLITLLPHLPLTFVVAYQADLAYGSKMHRIRSEAENILHFESNVIELPMGIPTTYTVEEGRDKQHVKDHLQRAHDIFL